MIKIVRTIIPLIIGYLVYKIFDSIFENYFPLNPIDDSSTHGIVFLIEYILILIWIIVIVLFQYFVIVPKTIRTITKAVLTTILLGFGIGITFGIGHFYIDHGTIYNSFISFLRIFVQFESFFLTNIVVIGILNKFKTESSYRNEST